jgi:hypothetical protein
MPPLLPLNYAFSMMTDLAKLGGEIGFSLLAYDEQPQGLDSIQSGGSNAFYAMLFMHSVLQKLTAVRLH